MIYLILFRSWLNRGAKEMSKGLYRKMLSAETSFPLYF